MISNFSSRNISLETLLAPLKLNDAITLSNRIVMAPMTRSFANDDLVPTDKMSK